MDKQLVKKDFPKWIFIIIIFIICSFFIYNLKLEQKKLKIEIGQLNSELADKNKKLNICVIAGMTCVNKLQEANDNIENAKSYAWESYEDMGYALDDLQTVE